MACGARSTTPVATQATYLHTAVARRPGRFMSISEPRINEFIRSDDEMAKAAPYGRLRTDGVDIVSIYGRRSRGDIESRSDVLTVGEGC
jgi:hypothetical protein